MFKNATIYSIGEPAEAPALEEALGREQFAPCGATSLMSVGWSPARGEANGALVESVGGQLVALFTIETRAVPADAVKSEAEKRAKAIEAFTGRRPGKKEMRDMRDDVLLELLPRAFPQRDGVPVWIDREHHRLVIGTTVASKVDEVVNALMRANAFKSVAPLATHASPASTMASAICAGALPEGLDFGRECSLQGSGDEPPVVQFKRCDILSEDIVKRVQAGQLPTAMRIASDWCQVTLTDKFTLKKIEYPDAGEPEEDADRFDATVVVETGMLGKTVDALVSALGGIVHGGIANE